MNKIKLRVWHKKNTVGLTLGQMRNDLVIQQWIGKQDKNGVDIYEGDILRFDPDIYKILSIIGIEKNLGHVWINDLTDGVYISFNSPYSENMESWSDFIIQYYPDNNQPVVLTYEVVGNIFENSELFNEED